jgi:hypothetical protein
MLDALRSLIAVIAAAITAVTGAVSAGRHPAILKLNGVACASAAYCLAVGQDVTERRGFAEVWDGSTWRVIPAPNPGTPEALWAVTCFAVGRCLVVGTSFGGAGIGVTLAAEWDGKAWRPLSPLSPGLYDQLGGIACSSGEDCLAVGATLFSSYEPLAEHWDGSRWRALPSAIPGISSGVLNAVACPQPARCVAVGSVNTADGTPRTLAALWNGRQWRVLVTPPTGRGGLGDVSCAGPSRCVATGYSYVANGGLQVLTEEWDGGAWRLLPFPGAATAGTAAATGSQLPGVACDPAAGPAAGSALAGPAAGSATAGCLAVGNYLDGGGRGRILAGTWHGGSRGGWQVLQPAYPAGSEAMLTDVACPSPARCMAVGDYDFTTGSMPFADLWNGRQWQLLTMPDG